MILVTYRPSGLSGTLHQQAWPDFLVCSASTEEDALTELSDVDRRRSDGLWPTWLNELADRLRADAVMTALACRLDQQRASSRSRLSNGGLSPFCCWHRS